MQSKLGATAAKLNRVLFSPVPNKILAQRVGCATSTGRTADPAVHSVETEEVGATEATRDDKLLRQSENENESTKGNDTYVPPKSPIQSTPKLETTGVSPRRDPITQQKRRSSNSTSSSLPGLDDVSCVGMDGTPWPEDDPKSTDVKKQREEEIEDDREYYKHHKPSPLSEIEMADTRKPITRATDGTAQAFTIGYDSGGVILWRPEQLDSAEDSLRRATEIFRWNAMRGDPDSPHGKILRKLRGENW